MRKTDLDSLLFRLCNSNFDDNNDEKKTKSPHFITNPAIFSVEINAHSLVYLVSLVCEKQLPYEALDISFFNSQTCESTFRTARAMSSNCSAGVNFTVQQFITHVNKLSMLQHIKGNTDSNGLRFPQHHKLSKTSTNKPILSKKIEVSKELIEQTVLDAYVHVYELFRLLNLEGLSQNTLAMAIEQLSNKTSQRLTKSKLLDIDDQSDTSTDTESEPSDDTDLMDIDDYDDEQLGDDETGSDIPILENANQAIFRGCRLVDRIDQSLTKSYFKVIVNEQRKFIHKQTACWMFQSEKSSLSADRLSRVKSD